VAASAIPIHSNKECHDGETSCRAKRRTPRMAHDRFCRLIHVDRATILKMAKAGQINLVYFGKCPVIPRTEAIRIGLITA
jgi:hypothetical protein